MCLLSICLLVCTRDNTYSFSLPFLFSGNILRGSSSGGAGGKGRK